MSKKQEKELSKYLYDGVFDDKSTYSFILKDKTKFQHKGCFKEAIENINNFNINFDCKYYEQVTNGEGKEKDKIDSIYSSSLQSLLIFSLVSKTNPIFIDGITYTSVRFEYKNKVIGYPSSVDVVLTSEDKKVILFIESKLYEIVRDSSINGTFEVGPTYLSNDEDGYYKKLNIKDEKQLKSFGFRFSDIEYGIDDKSKIKKVLSELYDNKNGYAKIEPLKKGSYVYSYGIKQTFSHLIGILNFEHPDKDCSNDLRDDYRSAEKRYLLIYNKLPGFQKDDAPKKIDNFIEHVNKIKAFINDKSKIGINMSVMSYQELFSYKDSKGTLVNKPYFDKMEKVVKFYKLDKNSGSK